MDDDETKPEAYPEDYELQEVLDSLDDSARRAARAAWMANQWGSDDPEQRKQWMDEAAEQLERAMDRMDDAQRFREALEDDDGE